MKKLNVTEIVLLLAVLIIMILLISKSFSNRKLNKQLQKEIEERVQIATDLAKEKAKSNIFFNDIKELQDLAEQEKQQRLIIQREYNKQKNILSLLPPQDILDSLVGTLEGTIYGIDSAGVIDYGLTKIEMKECQKITTSLKLENGFLNTALNECATSGLKLVEGMNSCEDNVTNLKNEVQSKNLENSKLKNKVWSNRFISGAIAVVLAFVIII